MKQFLLLILTSLLSNQKAYSDVGEAMMGASYNAVDYEEPEMVDYGISARYRHLFFNPGSSGWYGDINALAYHIVYSDFTFGYMKRSKGNIFYDLGAGVGVSLVFGLSFVVSTGLGFELGKGLSLVLPLELKYPGRGGVFFMPMIGWRF